MYRGISHFHLEYSRLECIHVLRVCAIKLKFFVSWINALCWQIIRLKMVIFTYSETKHQYFCTFQIWHLQSIDMQAFKTDILRNIPDLITEYCVKLLQVLICCLTFFCWFSVFWIQFCFIFFKLLCHQLHYIMLHEHIFLNIMLCYKLHVILLL